MSTTTTMGLTHSTARIIAPISFLIDFASQQYGMLSTPNMKDVHDAHISFFSPNPYFIGGFFFPQQVFQLIWLYRLWKVTGKERDGDDKVIKAEAKTMVRFVPFYAFGNLCIATWMIFWNASSLRTSNLFVLANSLSQLYYITCLQAPMNTASTSSILTHIVSKTFAGIGVLDMLHNGSVAYFQNAQPDIVVKIATAAGFAAMARVSDWIFGGCLVYDLVALTVGQTAYYGKGWGGLLGAYTVGTAAIVVLRNWLRPPYKSVDPEYEVFEEAEIEVVV